MSQQATFLPKRAIGNFTATITVEEVATDIIEITQHPVQQGASITDHAFNLPAIVSIIVIFDASEAPLAETYTKLRKLQSGRVPFTLVTGKRIYKNMLIKALGQINDVLSESVLRISLDLQEVFITSLQVVSVPPRDRQKLPGTTGATANAGKKQAKSISGTTTSGTKTSADAPQAKKAQSILKGLAG